MDPLGIRSTSVHVRVALRPLAVDEPVLVSNQLPVAQISLGDWEALGRPGYVSLRHAAPPRRRGGGGCGCLSAPAADADPAWRAVAQVEPGSGVARGALALPPPLLCNALPPAALAHGCAPPPPAAEVHLRALDAVPPRLPLADVVLDSYFAAGYATAAGEVLSFAVAPARGYAGAHGGGAAPPGFHAKKFAVTRTVPPGWVAVGPGTRVYVGGAPLGSRAEAAERRAAAAAVAAAEAAAAAEARRRPAAPAAPAPAPPRPAQQAQAQAQQAGSPPPGVGSGGGSLFESWPEAELRDYIRYSGGDASLAGRPALAREAARIARLAAEYDEDKRRRLSGGGGSQPPTPPAAAPPHAVASVAPAPSAPPAPPAAWLASDTPVPSAPPGPLAAGANGHGPLALGLALAAAGAPAPVAEGQWGRAPEPPEPPRPPRPLPPEPPPPPPREPPRPPPPPSPAPAVPPAAAERAPSGRAIRAAVNAVTSVPSPFAALQPAGGGGGGGGAAHGGPPAAPPPPPPASPFTQGSSAALQPASEPASPAVATAAAAAAGGLAAGAPGHRRSSSAGASTRPSAVPLFEIDPAEVRIDRRRRLGRGSFGAVYLAEFHESQVAVKLLGAADAGRGGTLGAGGGGSGSGGAEPPDDAAEAVLARLEEEAGLLASCNNHDCVVRFFGVLRRPQPGVVTEYCARGSLYDVLRRAAAGSPDAGELTWGRRLDAALDAARGMVHLHSLSPPVIHRDLKSANLLVTAKWDCKVADFNLSRIIDEVSSAGADTMAAMNPRYLAPEVLAGEGSTTASDVFSFGVVLWELLTWRLPWKGEGRWKIVRAVCGRERPPLPAAGDAAAAAALPGPDNADFAALLPEYCALVEACWAHDPGARPAFRDVTTRLRRLLEEYGAGRGRAPPAAAAAAPPAPALPPATPPACAVCGAAPAARAFHHGGTACLAACAACTDDLRAARAAGRCPNPACRLAVDRIV